MPAGASSWVRSASSQVDRIVDRTALDRIHERPVLRPVGGREVVRGHDLGRLGGMADDQAMGHDVEGQRSPGREALEADAVSGAQQPRGGERADGTRVESQQGRGHVRDVGVVPFIRRRVGGLRSDHVALAHQVAHQVQDVGRLLQHLATRAVLAHPPLGALGVEPSQVPRTQLRRALREQLARPVDQVQVAPLVADGRDDARLPDASPDERGYLAVEAERLLHQQVQPTIDDRQLRLAARRGRQAGDDAHRCRRRRASDGDRPRRAPRRVGPGCRRARGCGSRRPRWPRPAGRAAPRRASGLPSPSR